MIPPASTPTPFRSIWQAVSQATGQLMWTMDTSGEISETCELSDGALLHLARRLEDIIHPDDCRSYVGAWQAAMSVVLHPWSWIGRIQGQKSRYEIRFAPVGLAEGSLGAWVCSAIAMPFQTLDNAISNTQDELEMIYRTAPIGLAFLDTSSRFTHINERMALIIGVPLIDLIGCTVHEVVPDLADQLEHLIEQVVSFGQPMSDREIVGMTLAQPGIARVWNTHLAPVKENSGKVIAINVVMEEVTERKQIEQQLMLANARFAHAEASVHGFSYDWDWRTGIVTRSNGLVTVTGYQPSELTPTWESWTALMHPDDRISSRAEAMDAFRQLTQDTIRREFRVLHRDGNYRWVQEHSLILRDAAGQIEHVIGQSVDITEYRQLEETLHTSEVQFRTLANSISQLTWMARADGYIFWYNQRWYDYTGTTPESQEGWGWQQVHDPHVLPSVLGGWQTSIANGVPFEMVFPLRGADGIFRPFLTRAMPVRAENGDLLYWFGTNTDISEQKHAEQEAAKQAEYLQAIFEAITDGILISDRDGSIIRENSAARMLLGIDSTILSIAHLLDQTNHMLPLRDATGQSISSEALPTTRALKGERVTGEHAVDVWVQTLHGTEVALSVTAAPLHDESGDTIGSVSVYRDVTERLRLLEEVRAGERQKDEFLGIVAHELRTPVTSAKINVQLVARKLSRFHSDADQIEVVLPLLIQLLERSMGAMDRLNRLVNDLLDVSRIQSGQLDLRPAPTDIVSLVQEVVQELQESAPERMIIVTVPQEPVQMTIDGDRITQVILNYLNNALKYTPNSAPIEVVLTQDEEYIRVAVRDQGPGLTPEQQVRLFERFYRVEGINHQQGSVIGLGLGLYICWTIIERHGGKVGVESTKGEGSTFWFTLPFKGLKE